MSLRTSSSVRTCFFVSVLVLEVVCEAQERQSPYTTDEEVQLAVARFRKSWSEGSRAAPQECLLQKRKVISMSLYGRENGSVGDNFLQGAIENGRLAPQLYPGWKLRVYTSLPPALTDRLRQAGIEVVEMEKPEGIYGMFWRFLAASDPCASLIVFRDTDSLLNPRERAAVHEWEESGAAMHSMLDSPEHTPWPVQGGMWGLRGGLVPDMYSRVQAWGLWKKKLDDMHFLKHCILPLFVSSLVVHSSFPVALAYRPFPPHPPWEGHVGQQAFLPLYSPSCPTRVVDPSEELLVNASSTLHHNGQVYLYLASKQPASSPNVSNLLAQASTHLSAAEGCAQWAVEKNPLFLPGWRALRAAVAGNTGRRRQRERCFVAPPAGPGGTPTVGAKCHASCVARIDAVLRRLSAPSRSSEAPSSSSSSSSSWSSSSSSSAQSSSSLASSASLEEEEAFAMVLEAAQQQGRAAGQELVCEVMGGLGQRVEALVSCALLALASDRALRVVAGDDDTDFPELGGRFLSLYAFSSPIGAAIGGKTMWDGTPTVPLIQTKASNDTDGRSEMGEWAEKLLCGEGLSRMAESVVRARAQGWVPVAAYRQEASVWHERLKLAAAEDRAASFFTSFVHVMLEPSAGIAALVADYMQFSRSTKLGASVPDTFIAALQVRTGMPGERAADLDMLPHRDWAPGYVKCAYAAVPSRLRRPTSREEARALLWLVAADSEAGLQALVQQLVRSEGKVADGWQAQQPALQDLGAEMLQFESGARLATLTHDADASPRIRRLRAQLDLWALAHADLLVSTHGSSFASVGRAKAYARSRHPQAQSQHHVNFSSFTLTRDGSCFPWPNGGGPMSWSGHSFEDTSCWSERWHRTYSWASAPPKRPPKSRLPA